REQKKAAAATAVEADPQKGIKAQKPVKWKANALRHSYASYRFAQIGDAGRVAGELGNSAAMVYRHYRELVKPADGERWFNIRPPGPAHRPPHAGPSPPRRARDRRNQPDNLIYVTLLWPVPPEKSCRASAFTAPRRASCEGALNIEVEADQERRTETGPRK